MSIVRKTPKRAKKANDCRTDTNSACQQRGRSFVHGAPGIRVRRATVTFVHTPRLAVAVELVAPLGPTRAALAREQLEILARAAGLDDLVRGVRFARVFLLARA